MLNRICLEYDENTGDARFEAYGSDDFMFNGLANIIDRMYRESPISKHGLLVASFAALELTEDDLPDIASALKEAMEIKGKPSK